MNNLDVVSLMNHQNELLEYLTSSRNNIMGFSARDYKVKSFNSIYDRKVPR